MEGYLWLITVRIFKWLQLAKTKHHYNSLCILGFCILKLSSELSWLGCPVYENIFSSKKQRIYTWCGNTASKSPLAHTYMYVPFQVRKEHFRKAKFNPLPQIQYLFVIGTMIMIMISTMYFAVLQAVTRIANLKNKSSNFFVQKSCSTCMDTPIIEFVWL